MIEEIHKVWYKNKDELENYLRSHKRDENLSYKDFLSLILELVINPYSNPVKADFNNIIEIKNKEYQGNLIFIIPIINYCSNFTCYITTYVFSENYTIGYSLSEILKENHEENLTENQIEKLMNLALQIEQRMQFLFCDR